MLSKLHIENFALIDQLDMEFGEGLNVLTGATGVGKSIIVGALDLILGGRGSEEVVRTGESACMVEATFEVIDDETIGYLGSAFDVSLADDNIVIRREYKRKGGGRAFVGGSQVPISGLKDVSERLADILGQHSHQALLDPATHSSYLDRFAGLEEQATELKSRYHEAVRLRDELQASDRIASEISDKFDLLSFQISEIDRANLKPGEEEVLKDEKKLLENSRRIRETTDLAVRLLYDDEGSAVERIGEAEKCLGTIAGVSDAIKALVDSFKVTSDGIREVVLGLKSFCERLDDNPGRLEEVNERLSEIARLRKKYGGGIPEIIEYRNNSQEELAQLKAKELDTGTLKRRFDDVLMELNRLAAGVSKARNDAKSGLEKAVVEKLATMGIPKAQFVVEITKAESVGGLYSDGDRRLAGDANGFDIVEFQFCANPGEGLKPLARIASGGEISRIMLALKNAFLRRKGSTCEVFDEIDVGISGEVAAKVGRQLKELSRKHQVICITHLAQIASMADRHFRVFKSAQKGRSVTKVEVLGRDDRVREIASLISGEKISQKALAGAEELLRNSSKEP
jgi:DNA repair protein RecN (Recombination protein N)